MVSLEWQANKFLTGVYSKMQKSRITIGIIPDKPTDGACA
ncbi:hypothetical protein HNQ92_000691 [Rhabdobacter roseus]|uniref:Uncharacterized protein n=1 Tax=Rhabdobacter roseus TaxID=1655419 RepID=A0A840TRA6_9BACT|nr:hypothetical protein [Rhabdobacter roseus]